LLSTATSPVQFRSVKCQRTSPQNNNLKGKHTDENAVIMCHESCSHSVRPSSPSCSSGLVSWRWEECKELEFQAICLSQELFHLFCCNKENVMGFWGSSSKLQAFFCAYQTNSSLCLCATARKSSVMGSSSKAVFCAYQKTILSVWCNNKSEGNV
jgi:hypothetical protein